MQDDNVNPHLISHSSMYCQETGYFLEYNELTHTCNFSIASRESNDRRQLPGLSQARGCNHLGVFEVASTVYTAVRALHPFTTSMIPNGQTGL